MDGVIFFWEFAVPCEEGFFGDEFVGELVEDAFE